MDYRFKINVLSVTGIQEALWGVTKNKKLYPDMTYSDFLSDPEAQERMLAVCGNLAGFDKGHNKFLEFVTVQLEITAKLGWWIHFDTYRHASKNSESTMHTIKKGKIGPENLHPNVKLGTMAIVNELIASNADVDVIRDNLPLGYLQTRVVCLNYKSLRNIISQRRDHKLPEWRWFCEFMLKNLPNSDWLIARPLKDKPRVPKVEKIDPKDKRNFIKERLAKDIDLFMSSNHPSLWRGIRMRYTRPNFKFKRGLMIAALHHAGASCVYMSPYFGILPESFINTAKKYVHFITDDRYRNDEVREFQPIIDKINETYKTF